MKLSFIICFWLCTEKRFANSFFFFFFVGILVRHWFGTTQFVSMIWLQTNSNSFFFENMVVFSNVCMESPLSKMTILCLTKRSWDFSQKWKFHGKTVRLGGFSFFYLIKKSPLKPLPSFSTWSRSYSKFKVPNIRSN